MAPAPATWVLDEAASRPFFARAIELGINFFDTADMYSDGVSEEVARPRNARLGPARSSRDRHQGVQPDGPGPNDRGLSRKHILHSIDASLKRLGTDFVDLYQIHRWDYSTPIEETLEALHDVVRAGKARYIGASSMFAWQFAKALYLADRHGWTRFVAMQNHYNLVYREEEREMFPLCHDQGVGIIPWSPLARGFLAGNRKPEGGGDTSRAKTDKFAHKLYYRPDDFAVVERLGEVAKCAACPMLRSRWPGCSARAT